MSIIRQMITLKSLYRNIISPGYLYQLDRRAVFFAKCDECTFGWTVRRNDHGAVFTRGMQVVDFKGDMRDCFKVFV
jgi:hypothetical protein